MLQNCGSLCDCFMDLERELWKMVKPNILRTLECAECKQFLKVKMAKVISNKLPFA